jgi:hypothetical protein
MKRRTSLTVAVVIAAVAATGLALADDDSRAGDPNATRVLVNRDKNGLALSGYDPVAYFTDGKPVMGDARYASKRKAMFDADPVRYEPQYGGYCGYAASINRLSPISPEWFQIIDGRLILQHNKKAWDLWNEDLAGNIVKADANWPGLVDRHGR